MESSDKPVHVLLVWHCKGKNKTCDKLHAVKYLGEKSKIEGTAISIPGAKGKTFWIICPACTERHPYRAEEITYVELDSPPPPGFQSIF